MYITNTLNNFIGVNHSMKYKRGIQKFSTVRNIHISEDGSVHGKETMKYAAYIYGPDFGAQMMRTAEELWKWQEKQAEKITEEWRKTHLSWVDQWNKEHPNMIGVKCIRHPNGQWYTAEEIYKLWVEKMILTCR